MGLQKILNKQEIWIVDPLLDRPSFYFSLFLVEKRSGGLRSIFNLKSLKFSVFPPPFRMGTLQSVLVLLREYIHLSQAAALPSLENTGMWALSLDLEDAYVYSVMVQWTRYRCSPLASQQPQGLSLIWVVGTFLKTCGFNTFQYLNDSLLGGKSYQLALQYRDLMQIACRKSGS